MKKNTILSLFLLLSFLFLNNSTSETPKWVWDIVKENLVYEVSKITHWEEKQMPFYNVNPHDDDTVVITNALYVEGITLEGKKIIGKISVKDQVVHPLGAIGFVSAGCVSNCDCQCCDFIEGTNGCFVVKEKLKKCRKNKISTHDCGCGNSVMAKSE